ncbi:hypothetical protein Dimus_007663 [Dionaea muscipula]
MWESEPAPIVSQALLWITFSSGTMEQPSQVSAPGSRYLNLKKSFKLAARSLLTACSSKEDFFKAFPRFTTIEQERLYGLFIQVITSLHANVEDEFESLCHEMQVRTVLDTVEQIVEERNLDPLFLDKTNVGEVKNDLLAAKKNEILFLEGLLKEVEGQNQRVRARFELFEKKAEENARAAEAAKKLGVTLMHDSSSKLRF